MSKLLDLLLEVLSATDDPESVDYYIEVDPTDQVILTVTDPKIRRLWNLVVKFEIELEDAEEALRGAISEYGQHCTEMGGTEGFNHDKSNCCVCQALCRYNDVSHRLDFFDSILGDSIWDLLSEVYPLTAEDREKGFCLRADWQVVFPSLPDEAEFDTPQGTCVLRAKSLQDLGKCPDLN